MQDKWCWSWFGTCPVSCVWLTSPGGRCVTTLRIAGPVLSWEGARWAPVPALPSLPLGWILPPGQRARSRTELCPAPSVLPAPPCGPRALYPICFEVLELFPPHVGRWCGLSGQCPSWQPSHSEQNVPLSPEACMPHSSIPGHPWEQVSHPLARARPLPFHFSQLLDFQANNLLSPSLCANQNAASFRFT